MGLLNNTVGTKPLLLAIAEIDSLPAPQQAINRLAAAVRYPVALLSAERRLSSTTANALAAIPHEKLQRFSNITICDDSLAATDANQAVLAEYGLGAVVPYQLHNSDTPGWLVFGKRSETSKFDFSAVESFFERLGDQFLDSLSTIREKAAEVDASLHNMRQRVAELELENRALRTMTPAEADAGTIVSDYSNELRDEVLNALERGESLDSMTAEYEGTLIKWALWRCRGNKAKAARLLNVRPNTLHYKLLRRNIPRDKKTYS